MGVTTEQLTYGSSSLISDIGGFIGILFGTSLLSLVQMVEDWLKKVLGGRRWRKAHRSRRYSNRVEDHRKAPGGLE